MPTTKVEDTIQTRKGDVQKGVGRLQAAVNPRRGAVRHTPSTVQDNPRTEQHDINTRQPQKDGSMAYINQHSERAVNGTGISAELWTHSKSTSKRTPGLSLHGSWPRSGIYVPSCETTRYVQFNPDVAKNHSNMHLITDNSPIKKSTSSTISTSVDIRKLRGPKNVIDYNKNPISDPARLSFAYERTNKGPAEVSISTVGPSKQHVDGSDTSTGLPAFFAASSVTALKRDFIQENIASLSASNITRNLARQSRDARMASVNKYGRLYTNSPSAQPFACSQTTSDSSLNEEVTNAVNWRTTPTDEYYLQSMPGTDDCSIYSESDTSRPNTSRVTCTTSTSHDAPQQASFRYRAPPSARTISFREHIEAKRAAKRHGDTLLNSVQDSSAKHMYATSPTNDIDTKADIPAIKPDKTTSSPILGRFVAIAPPQWKRRKKHVSGSLYNPTWRREVNTSPGSSSDINIQANRQRMVNKRFLHRLANHPRFKTLFHLQRRKPTTFVKHVEVNERIAKMNVIRKRLYELQREQSGLYDDSVYTTSTSDMNTANPTARKWHDNQHISDSTFMVKYLAAQIKPVPCAGRNTSGEEMYTWKFEAPNTTISPRVKPKNQQPGTYTSNSTADMASPMVMKKASKSKEFMNSTNVIVRSRYSSANTSSAVHISVSQVSPAPIVVPTSPIDECNYNDKLPLGDSDSEFEMKPKQEGANSNPMSLKPKWEVQVMKSDRMAKYNPSSIVVSVPMEHENVWLGSKHLPGEVPNLLKPPSPIPLYRHRPVFLPFTRPLSINRTEIEVPEHMQPLKPIPLAPKRRIPMLKSSYIITREKEPTTDLPGDTETGTEQQSPIHCSTLQLNEKQRSPLPYSPIKRKNQKSPNRLSEQKSADRLSEQKSPDRLSELKSPDRLSEQKSAERMSEPKSPDRLSELKSPDRLSESITNEAITKALASENESRLDTTNTVAPSTLPGSQTIQETPQETNRELKTKRASSRARLAKRDMVSIVSLALTSPDKLLPDSVDYSPHNLVQTSPRTTNISPTAHTPPLDQPQAVKNWTNAMAYMKHASVNPFIKRHSNVSSEVLQPKNVSTIPDVDTETPAQTTTTHQKSSLKVTARQSSERQLGPQIGKAVKNVFTRQKASPKDKSDTKQIHVLDDPAMQVVATIKTVEPQPERKRLSPIIMPKPAMQGYSIRKRPGTPTVRARQRAQDARYQSVIEKLMISLDECESEYIKLQHQHQRRAVTAEEKARIADIFPDVTRDPNSLTDLNTNDTSPMLENVLSEVTSPKPISRAHLVMPVELNETSKHAIEADTMERETRFDHYQHPPDTIPEAPARRSQHWTDVQPPSTETMERVEPAGEDKEGNIAQKRCVPVRSEASSTHAEYGSAIDLFERSEAGVSSHEATTSSIGSGSYLHVNMDAEQVANWTRAQLASYLDTLTTLPMGSMTSTSTDSDNEVPNDVSGCSSEVNVSQYAFESSLEGESASVSTTATWDAAWDEAERYLAGHKSISERRVEGESASVSTTTGWDEAERYLRGHTSASPTTHRNVVMYAPIESPGRVSQDPSSTVTYTLTPEASPVMYEYYESETPRQKSPTASPRGSHKSVASPRGSRRSVASPSGSRRSVASPRGSRRSVTSPSGSRRSVASPSGSQRSVASPSGLQTSVASPSGSQRSVVTTSMSHHKSTEREAEKY